MVTIQNPSEIEARLQAFNISIPSQLPTCTDDDAFVISTKYITTLRALPPEIRKVIYKDVLEDDQAALGLMAAFQPDSLLYGEILGECFRRQPFVLSGKNLEALKSTPDAVKRCITKISLKPPLIPTNDVVVYFPTGTRITDITLEFVSRRYANINAQAFYEVCRMWFKYFMTVKTFTVVCTNDRTYHPRGFTKELDVPPALKGAIRTANAWMKKEAVCIKGMRDMKESLTWTWTAEEGGVLAWHSLLLDHQSG